MKVVINACFGGFSLSEAGMIRYAQIKGVPLFVENPAGDELSDAMSRMGIRTYWTVPADQRPAKLDEWHTQPFDVRAAYNDAYDACTLSDRDMERNDPALVQAVEEMGIEANGHCAQLAIVEIPDDMEFVIEEYDGNEHVAEKHRTWHA